MGSYALSDMERINKILMDEYRTYQRCIRSATVELQTYLKKRAIQMCKMLESLYNEKCERLKMVMSSGNYEEISDKVKQDLYLTVFGNYVFDFAKCKEAIDHLNVEVAPPRSFAPEISPSSPSFEPGVELEVAMQSRITRAGIFWISVPNTSKFDLADLSKYIGFIKMVSGDWKSYRELEMLPAVGEQVFLDSSFGWLRAQVEKQKDQNTLSVRLLDYGRLIACRPDVLYPHKDNLFSEYEFQSYACCLLLDTDPFDIPIESVWAFNDGLDENALHSRSVTCRFKSKIPGKNGEEFWQVELLAKDKKGEAVNLTDIVRKKIEDKAKGRSSIACRDIRYSDKECSGSRHIERPKEESRVTAPIEPDSNRDTCTAEVEVHDVAEKRLPTKHEGRVRLLQRDKPAEELTHVDHPSLSVEPSDPDIIPVSSCISMNNHEDATYKQVKSVPSKPGTSAQNVLPTTFAPHVDFSRPPPGLAETEIVYRIEPEQNRYLQHSELENSGGLSVCGGNFDLAMSSVDGQSASGAPLTELELLGLNAQASMSDALPSVSPMQQFNPASPRYKSLAAALQLWPQPVLVSENASLGCRYAQNLNSPRPTAPQANARLAAAHQMIASHLKLSPPPLPPPPPLLMNALFANVSQLDPHQANTSQSFEPQGFGLATGGMATSSASACGFADCSGQPYYPQMSGNYPVNVESGAMRLPFVNPSMYPPDYSNYPRFDTENDEIDLQSIPTMTFSSQRSTESRDSPFLDNDFVDASTNSGYSDSGNRTASCKTPDGEPYESDGRPYSTIGLYPPGTRFCGQITTPVDSQGMFWLKLDNSEKETKNLQHAVNSYPLMTELMPHEIHVGKVGLASDSSGEIFRGEVLKVLDRKVVVRNIDHGKTLEVIKSSFKRLYEKFMLQCVPRQAILCRLLSSGAADEFDEVFRKQFDAQIASQHVTAVVHSSETRDYETVHVVQLDISEEPLGENEAEVRLDQRSRCAKLLHPSSSDPSVLLSRVLAQNLRYTLPAETTVGDQTVSSVEASPDKVPFDVRVPPPPLSFVNAQSVGSSGIEAVYSESKGPERGERGFAPQQGSGRQKKPNWSHKNKGQRQGRWHRPKEYERLTDSPHSNSSDTLSDPLSNAAQTGTHFGGQHRRQEQGERNTCFNCGEVGHYRRTCPLPQKGKQGEAIQNKSKK